MLSLLVDHALESYAQSYPFRTLFHVKTNDITHTYIALLLFRFNRAWCARSFGFCYRLIANKWKLTSESQASLYIKQIKHPNYTDLFVYTQTIQASIPSAAI